MALVAIQPVTTQERRIDDFFARFTDEWVRPNPISATTSRYFSGDEQSRLEQQLTPRTRAHRRVGSRARKGLADLAKFDRSRLNESQRVSADLMQWQLEDRRRGREVLDFDFPLEQFNGTNVGLVEALTLRIH